MNDLRLLELGEEIARLRDERDALLEEVRTRADESHRIVALEKERDALKANLDDLTEEHRRDLDRLSAVRIERSTLQEKLEVAVKALKTIANENNLHIPDWYSEIANEALAKIDAPDVDAEYRHSGDGDGTT